MRFVLVFEAIHAFNDEPEGDGVWNFKTQTPGLPLNDLVVSDVSHVRFKLIWIVTSFAELAYSPATF